MTIDPRALSTLVGALQSGRTVLAPNTELAAALSAAVDAAHRAAGLEVWPTPRIADLGGWLKGRYLQLQLRDAAAPRCLGEIEERELWRECVLATDPGRSFLEPSGAARAARRARRTMHEYGIPMSAVIAEAGEESALFLEWNERFLARCRQIDSVDGAHLSGLMQAGGVVEPGELAWIESPSWRPVARRWLERHGGAPLVPLRAPGSRAVDGRHVGALSPAAELSAIARWARAGLEADAGFRAWICVPDLANRRAELEDAFDAVLAPHRFSLSAGGTGACYAVAGGTPLAAYSPVRVALELLGATREIVSFPRFSALLRAPELSESMAEAGAACAVDLGLRACAPAEAPLERWLALAESVERSSGLRPAAALRRLSAARRTLVETPGAHPLSRWVSVWIAAFERGPWDLRHRWSSTEYQAAARFRELLEALALGDATFGARTQRSAGALLQRAAAETLFQPETGIPAVWVSGQIMDPWLAYDGLWAASASEARWPPPADPVALLPVRVQRRYGVVAAAMESQLEFAADLQRRWLERCTECVFSCSDSGEGRPAVPSPLIAPSAREGAAMAAESHPLWRAQLDTAPLMQRLADEWAPPLGGDERTRGVATLRAQSRCPFRGFAETRLRTEALELPTPGFNERERGEMLHDALEAVWMHLGSSAGLARMAAPGLARLVRESVSRAVDCARRDPGPRWRLREIERLCKLLAAWLELEGTRAEFEVERLEAGSEIARHAGLEFSVRIDRIDRLKDGSRVLIDYKSGAASRDWQGERPDNPQLPMYALLHRQSLIAVAYGRVSAAACDFLVESERGGVFPRRRASRLEGRGSFAALLEVWAERIERLAEEFRSGRALVDPTMTACRTCRLQGLCRVSSTLDLAESLDDAVEEQA